MPYAVCRGADQGASCPAVHCRRFCKHLLHISAPTTPYVFFTSSQLPFICVFPTSLTMASFKQLFLALILAPVFVASTTLPLTLIPTIPDDDAYASRLYNYTLFELQERDLPTGTCDSNTPCVNGACCGTDNLCGYSPKSCGTGCQSNCM